MKSCSSSPTPASAICWVIWPSRDRDRAVGSGRLLHRLLHLVLPVGTVLAGNGLAGAAGGKTKYHDHCQKQCRYLTESFHNVPPLFWLLSQNNLVLGVFVALIILYGKGCHLSSIFFDAGSGYGITKCREKNYTNSEVISCNVMDIMLT